MKQKLPSRSVVLSSRLHAVTMWIFLFTSKFLKYVCIWRWSCSLSYVFHGGYVLMSSWQWCHGLGAWKTLIFIGIYFTLQLRALAIIFFSSEKVDLFSFFPTILFCSSEDIIAVHVEALINCFIKPELILTLIKHVFLLYPIILLLHYY